MKKLAFCACVLGLLAALRCGADSAPAGAAIAAGLWQGTATLKSSLPAVASAPAGADATAADPSASQGGPDALSLTLSLRLFEKGKGGLLDIPEQSLYGYPLSRVKWTEKRLSFSLDAWGPGQEIYFDGLMVAASGLQKEAGIIGTVSSKTWKGSFRLSARSVQEYAGERPLSVKVKGGVLPGTLGLPEDFVAPGSAEFSPIPLVILLSGGGPTDREGNNFNVPGRTNAFMKLARGLASKGVAVYRFDKRGSGEAFWLENAAQVTSLATHARDAAEVIRQFRADGRFSRILVAGMNEGAWVGAMALTVLGEENIFADAFVVLDASGEEPEEQLAASLQGLSPEVQAEAGRIREAIAKGEPYGPPSEQLAAFFAPSRSEWVAAWLAFHPAAEIASVQAPVFFVRGDADLQVSREAFEKLLDARPSAAAFVVPSMNYALKAVKSEKENYDAFTNPDYQVPQALIDLIAALAKVRPLPQGSLLYQKTKP